MTAPFTKLFVFNRIVVELNVRGHCLARHVSGALGVVVLPLVPDRGLAERDFMNSFARRLVITLALVVLLGGASSAYADSFQLTYSGGGLNGILNLTATPEGGGSYLVTSISGVQNGSLVTGLIAPVASGLIILPDGDGFTYDNLLFAGSNTILDNAGLLFTIAGLSQPVNLYSVGTSSYMQSTYTGVGGSWSFPNDFDSTPVRLALVTTPEPSTLALCLMGFLVLILRSSRKLLA